MTGFAEIAQKLTIVMATGRKAGFHDGKPLSAKEMPRHE